ncbi:unnamed protein product [Alternaria alternata]
MLHPLPELSQNSHGTVTQLLPISQSSRDLGAQSRQLSDAEWVELEPLLRRLYLEENKTLDAVRKVLQESHGLKLSKKQLTKRFADWNFKKNVKQHETGEYLLKAEPLLVEAAASVDGVRITAAKRERWQKRVKIDDEQKSTHTKDVVSASATPSNVTNQTSIAWVPSTNSWSTLRHEGNSEALIVSPSMPLEDQVNSFTRCGSTKDHLSPALEAYSTEATNPGISPSALPMGSSEPLGSPSNVHVDIGTFQEPEQHFISPILLQSPDRDVDVVTRLFSALKMDPIDIPLHIQPTQTVAEVLTPATDTVCPQDLEAYNHDKRLVPWVDKRATLHETASPGSTKVTRYHNEESPQRDTIILVSYQCNSRKRTTTGALKYPSVDVIFSSSRVVELDPFSLEVYPFPQDQGSSLEVRPVATLYDSWRMNLNDCIAKISKLESAALASNIAATKLRCKLADAYYDLGYYDKAEYQYKQVLPIFEQRYGQNSWDYIYSKIYLAGSVLRLGRSQEGNRMAQDAHILARRFYPGSPLYQDATGVLADSLGFLDDRRSEEELLREFVQIVLTASGPKHGDTITAIRRFGEVTRKTRGYSESEELLRVALELSSNATDISDREQCIIRYNLGWSLYRQHKYADSVALIREAAKMSGSVLGIEHGVTLKCKNLLCKVLKTQNLLSESRDILLKTIEVHIKKMKEIRGNTIEAMAYLSVVLIEMRKMDDAYKWMKQALCYCVEIGAIESDRAGQFFEDLSNIDGKEEQHELILDLADPAAYQRQQPSPNIYTMGTSREGWTWVRVHPLQLDAHYGLYEEPDAQQKP